MVLVLYPCFLFYNLVFFYDLQDIKNIDIFFEYIVQNCRNSLHSRIVAKIFIQLTVIITVSNIYSQHTHNTKLNICRNSLQFLTFRKAYKIHNSHDIMLLDNWNAICL